MAISFKGVCPCEDFEFTLRYNSPTEEAVTLFCPFCGVEIDEEEPKDSENEDDDDDMYDE